MLHRDFARRLKRYRELRVGLDFARRSGTLYRNDTRRFATLKKKIFTLVEHTIDIEISSHRSRCVDKRM